MVGGVVGVYIILVRTVRSRVNISSIYTYIERIESFI